MLHEEVEVERTIGKNSTEKVKVEQAFFLDYDSNPILIDPLYSLAQKSATKGRDGKPDIGEIYKSTIEQINEKVLGNNTGKIIMHEAGKQLFATPDFIGKVLRAPMSEEELTDFVEAQSEYDHYHGTD